MQAWRLLGGGGGQAAGEVGVEGEWGVLKEKLGRVEEWERRKGEIENELREVLVGGGGEEGDDGGGGGKLKAPTYLEDEKMENHDKT